MELIRRIPNRIFPAFRQLAAEHAARYPGCRPTSIARNRDFKYGISKTLHFRAQTRLWGYDLKGP